ncbi:MAG: SGNH/GDSL hydrolase family protein [Bacteroidota bacterium]
MTTFRISTASAVFVIAVLMVSGCKDNAPSGPTPGLGGNTVAKYVAIGNSITAGYQSAGLYESAQIYSYPNLVAQQLKKAGANLGNFEQPLWADPGTPGADLVHASRYEILSLGGPVIGPNPAEIAGGPKNLALARPYDNLGIPGIVIASFLDTTNFTNNLLVPLTLRSTPGGLPNSIFAQTRMLNPDLVTFWLGNNDVLGYAASGGVSPSSPTPSATFAALYAQALGALRAALPNARIIVANIPDVRSIPYFTTVGPQIAAVLPAGYYLRYQKHGNTSLAFDSTRFSESTPPLVTLTGIAYASLIGKPGGKWYRDNLYPGIPPGIDTTKPFGLHPQNPWPDALVLDAGEQSTAGAAVGDFNATIAAQAAANNAGVVDVNAFFTNVRAHGYDIAGIEFTADYISGGLFSLDGVHPSDRGQAVLANLFLDAMNKKFGMSVPFVDVSSVPGIPSPLRRGTEMPWVDPNLAQTMHLLFGN